MKGAKKVPERVAGCCKYGTVEANGGPRLLVGCLLGSRRGRRRRWAERWSEWLLETKKQEGRSEGWRAIEIQGGVNVSWP